MPYYGLSTSDRLPPSSVILPLNTPEADFNVSAPPISGAQLLALITPEVDFTVENVSLVAGVYQSVVLTKTTPETDFNVTNPAIVTGSATALVLAIAVPEVDLDVSSLAISTSVVGSVTLSLVIPETDLEVSNPAIAVGTASDVTLSLVIPETDLEVSSLAITSTSPSQTTLSNYVAEVDLNVSTLALLTNTISEATLGLSVAEVDLGVSAPAIVTGTVAAETLSLQLPEVDLNVSAPTIVTLSPGAATLSLTTTEVDFNVSSVGIITGTVGEVTLDHTVAETDFNVSNPVLTTQAAGSVTLSLDLPEVDFNVSNVPMFVETPPVEENEAACGSGYAYMQSANGAFSGYLESVANGYVSIWYKFTGVPSSFLFEHQMTLFQVLYTGTEDWMEVGIGRHGNTVYPDLYMERSDLRPKGELWTYLEEEESLGGRTVPDIYDGNWHHLVWGNENVGVTNPDGWYFWIDGEQYGEVYNFNNSSPGGIIDDWFAGVQANSPGSFNEIDIAFSSLVGSQPPPPSSSGENQNLVGCIDEAMVVNTRTIHDRGGTSGEVTADIAYLYNSGLGRLAEEVEADNPNGLWDDTYNVWKFESSDLGKEYKDPSGTDDHDLPIFGQISNQIGIPGGDVVVLASAFQSAASPSPSLYSNYVFDGPMSHPTNAITFAAWYKPDAEWPVGAGILPCLGSMWNNTATKEWALYRQFTGSTNRWTTEVRTTTIGTQYAHVNLGAMDPTKWYFIAAAFDGNDAGVYVWWRDSGSSWFVEGITGSGLVRRNTNSKFTIGTRADQDHPAQGLIDDVIYFNEWIPNLGVTGSLQWLFNDGVGRSRANIESNDLAFYNKIASLWNMNQEGDGTQTRFDVADGTGSAAVNYGQPVSLLVSGNVPTATGHISG